MRKSRSLPRLKSLSLFLSLCLFFFFFLLLFFPVCRASYLSSIRNFPPCREKGDGSMAIRRLEKEREGERERFPSTKPRYYTPRYWMKELATGIAKSFRNVFLRCRRFFFFFRGSLILGGREREGETRLSREIGF